MNAFLGLLEQPLVEALGWSLLHFLWQGAAVAIVLAVLLAVMRRRSSLARYVVCCAALATMGLLPIVTSIWCRAIPNAKPFSSTAVPVTTILQDSPRLGASPIATEVVVSGIQPPTDDASAVGDVSTIPSEVMPAAVSATAGLSQAWLGRARSSIPWCVAIWMGGVLILSLRLLAIWCRVQRMRRVGVAPVSNDLDTMFLRIAARLQITRPVQLLQSTLVEVPTVIGWLRPVILLPITSLTGLMPVQLEALLIHELAHIRRWDYLVNLLQNVAETLLFYHPAVWWISARIRQERENCCDDVAAAMCGDLVGYAEALVRMEELRAPWGHVAVAARGGNLLARVRRLTAGTQHNRLPPWWQSPAAALAVVVGLVAGSWSLTSATADPQATSADEPCDNSTAEIEQDGDETPDDFTLQVNSEDAPADESSDRPIEKSGGASKDAEVTVEYLPRPTKNEVKIINALDKPTTVEFVDSPLEACIAELAKYHKINIWLDKQTLRDEGVAVDRRSPSSWLGYRSAAF